MESTGSLSQDQSERIRKNRENAMEILKKKRRTEEPITIKNEDKKNTISVDGKKFIDSKGGFLIEDETKKESEEYNFSLDDDWIPEPFNCMECEKEFLSSYLHNHFNYDVCDGCRNEEKHSMITKSDAKAEYLLKDCDFDAREPTLKFISKKNPHNSRWGEMKLYLLPQVEARAIEVWGSMEKIEAEHKDREEKRVLAKTKKYNKNLKELRMSVRSSLFDKTSGPTHQHKFGPETYNEADDNYSRTCMTCEFVETFEKM